MTTLLVVLALAGALLVWAVLTYNRFVRRRNQVQEGWSGIDVQLRRRHNLIPNLVETVKGYASHERGTMEEVTALRTRAERTDSAAELASTESQLSQLIGRLLAVAEDYPELKASRNFSELQASLAEIEQAIEQARRYYNATVRELNTLVQSFPSNLIARMFGFVEAEYFEIDLESVRNVPEVRF